MIKQQYPPGFTVVIEGVEVSKNDVLSADFDDQLDKLDKVSATILNQGYKYTKEHSRLKGASFELHGGWIGREWGKLFEGKIISIRRVYEDTSTINIIALPVGVNDGWHKKRTVNRESALSVMDNHKEMVLNIEGMDESDKNNLMLVRFVQQDETDLEFIRRAAKETGGFEVALKYKTIHIRRPYPGQGPVIEFEKGVNVISMEAHETDEEQALKSITCFEGGDNSVKIETESAEIKEQRKTKGQKADMIERVDVAEDGSPVIVQFFPSAMDGQHAKRIATGNSDKAAARETILTIHAVGSICARAGYCAKVKGYGTDDGIYYMKSANHHFGGDGYSMILELTNKQSGGESK